jgi:hypothetical protein
VSSSSAPRWPTVVLISALALIATAALLAFAQHHAGYPHIVAPWLEASTAGIAYGTVGWFIARRVPGHRLGTVMLLLSLASGVQLILGSLAIASVQERWAGAAQSLLGGMYNSLTTIVVSFLLFVVLLAPTGRPFNRFYRGVARTLVVVAVVSWCTGFALGTDASSLPGGPVDRAPVPDAVLPAIWIVNLICMLVIVGVSLLAIAGLALRYRASRSEARRQVTWVVGGGLGGILVIWLQAVVSQWLPPAPWIGSLAWAIGPTLLPLGIAVAVLRHGLYELDSVVSRTVSYAVVTGTVLIVYVVVVTGVSGLVPGSDSVAVAAATLAAAASVRPVLRRVRDRVDRQFNRARFDHAQAVAGFSVQMQNTVDPDLVRGDLEDVLHRTLQPRSLELWLRSGA